MFDTNVVLTYCFLCWIFDQITKIATWKERKKYSINGALNFIFKVCHRMWSLTDFSCVKYISEILFIKGDRSHSS